MSENKKDHLLNQVEKGVLTREGARILIQLLKAGKKGPNQADIALLVDILDSYANGRINLWQGQER